LQPESSVGDFSAMAAFSDLKTGTYTLIVEIGNPTRIKIGDLGTFAFDKGLYTYTGSALGRTQNLGTRLRRHLRASKPRKWHIDYLLAEGKVRMAVLCESELRLECLVNKALGTRTGGITTVRGFGASDCRTGCVAHLYYHPTRNLMTLSKEILCLYSSLCENVRYYKFE